MLLNRPGSFSAVFAKKPRVQFRSTLFAPEAMNFKFTPYRGTAAVKRRNSAAYSSGVMFPPQPHDLFPMPQNCTLKGSRIGRPPLWRNCAALVLAAGELQYSIHL